ncbi:MAG: hypothetical protein Q4C42_01935 [Clostridia bacterium]|nr:hypothetical protein [Clostridia bacterium]
MNYFYGIMFILIGLMLAVKQRKENKIFIPLGIYFILVGGCWIASAIYPSGVFTLIIKGLSALALVLCLVFIYRNRLFRNKEATPEEKPKSRDDSGLF